MCNRQTDRQRPKPLEWLFKNNDNTGIDIGASHTKQILAELIETGGQTKYYQTLELINSIRTREELETVDQCPYLTQSVMTRVQSLLRHHCYQLPRNFYPTFFSQVKFQRQMTLLRIICDDADITGQLLNIYCAFCK